ncbi:hypothetical protein NLG97_g8813 [Lecanicillium saksenae]|uniref:Uncharacterized protein n=1 Tax=Lecanicillium saksenae TaxID=468837 RepID=A0ACC1QJ19_9HYPO|nr:hypothetical protein NLG97_g8813 [Lecanicillium saksenae]
MHAGSSSLSPALGVQKSTSQSTNRFRRGEDIRNFCSTCGKAGHLVHQCVHPWADGFNHGCPVCNGSDHHTCDECDEDWPVEFDEKFQIPVNDRQNRPPLLACPNWPKMVRYAFHMRLELPASFPWTPYMCHCLSEVHGLTGGMPWLSFDYNTENAVDLPVDPMTANKEELGKSYNLLNEWNGQAEVLEIGGPWDGKSPLPRAPPSFIIIKALQEQLSAATTA